MPNGESWLDNPFPSLSGAQFPQEELLEQASIEQLLETDHELPPREEILVVRLRALAQSARSLTPAQKAEAAKLIAQLVTLRLAQVSDIGFVPRERDIELFFPEGGTGQIDRTLLEMVFKDFAYYRQQGQTDEEFHLPQLLADPVMAFNGQFVHTVEDFRIRGAGIDLVFTRTYKNQAFYEGSLGVNWDHSCNLYLRVEFDGDVVARSSGTLREDRYVLHQQHAYYVPPDGSHDILFARDHLASHRDFLACCADDLLPGHGYSYVARTPDGVSWLYEPIAGSQLHRVKKIRDRFGNYLVFDYSMGLLVEAVTVNHPERRVLFGYDDAEHLARIVLPPVSYPWRARPHARTWQYCQDELGDLVAVTTPGTRDYIIPGTQQQVPGFPEGLTTRYDYSTADHSGALRHNLMRIVDPADRLYLENEFGTSEGLLDFNRVVRQYQGDGEFRFEYFDVTSELDGAYTEEERPAHKTICYERNGHPAEHYFSGSGKLLLRKESVRSGCGIRQLVWHYRYNRDGAAIASRSPEGLVTQNYHGREHFYDRAVQPGQRDVEPALDGNLTPYERIRFGNVLATVRRGTRGDLRQMLSQLSVPDGFQDFFPSVLSQGAPSDTIRKYTFTDDYQQPLAVSDPRSTASADPHYQEAPDYDAQLMRYEYGPPPQRLLRRVVYPDTTFPSPLPDGSTGLVNAFEEYFEYDARGRLVGQRDPEGGLTFYRYFSDQEGLREGFLRARIRQQTNWTSTAYDYDVDSVLWGDGWRARPGHRLSDGGVGRTVELTFEGWGLVAHQHEDAVTLTGDNDAVTVELVMADGSIRVLPPWNQRLDAHYVIEDLSYGKHTLRLRDEHGRVFSLGRFETFQEYLLDVNEAGLQTASRDPRGLRVDLAVNELDQVIVSRTLADVPCNSYTAFDQNGLVAETGRQLVPAVNGNLFQKAWFRYDTQGNVTEESVGGDTGTRLTTRHTYSASGKRVRTILPRGNEIRYTYDERQLAVDVVRAACTPEESIHRSIYDGDGRRVFSVDPLGHATRHIYDASGRKVIDEDKAGNILRVTYDKHDKPLGRYFFERDGGHYRLLSKKAYRYDERGRLCRQTDYLFDEPIAVAEFRPDNPNEDPDDNNHFPAFRDAVAAGLVVEARTDYYLDRKGRPFRSSRYGTDPAGNSGARPPQVVEQRFDPMDRPVWTRDAAENYTVATYDPNGNLVRSDRHEAAVDPQTGALLYEEIFSTLNEYDEWNRLSAAVDSLGNRAEHHYDGRGNLIVRQDPLGRVTRSYYDLFNRRVRVTTEWSGPQGNAIAALNQGYDDNGNLVRVENTEGAVTMQVYDGLDRLIERRRQGGSPMQAWVYDPAGNLLAYRDGNGFVHRHRYDALNRLIHTHVDTRGTSTPAEDTDDVETLTYDGLGRILSQRNKHALIEMKYDSLGRITEDHLWHEHPPPLAPQPLSVLRQYDIFSNLEQLTYPDGRQVSREHDVLNRLSAVTNRAKGADYTGDPAAPDHYEVVRHHYRGLRLFESRYGNGTTSHFRYDGSGRIIGIRHADAAGATLLELQQLYDAAGNKRIEVELRPDPADAAAILARVERYSFDQLDRLISYASGPGGPLNLDPFAPARALQPRDQFDGQTFIDLQFGQPLPVGPVYTYNSAGNRLSSNEPELTRLEYAPNLLDRYERVTDLDTGEVQQPSYDGIGNTLSVGQRRLAYNARNLLANVDASQQAVARLRYDLQGRVVDVEYPEAGRHFFFIHDGQDVIAEYEAGAAGWQCYAQYVNGTQLDSRYQIATQQQEFWYHCNNVRSTRLLTSRTELVITYEYNPFGELLSTIPAENTPYNPYLFSGRRFDTRLDLYDFRSRAYLPRWGRFLQPDPKGTVDGPNPYTAFANNPGVHIDPLGTEKISFIYFDAAILLGSRANVRKTEQEARLQEWLEHYRAARDAGNREEVDRLFSQLIQEEHEEWAKFALASYIVSASAAAGGLLGAEIGVSFGLGPTATGAISGSLGTASSEGAQWLLGKQLTPEELAFSVFTGAGLGALGGRAHQFASELSVGPPKKILIVGEDASLDYSRALRAQLGQDFEITASTYQADISVRRWHPGIRVQTGVDATNLRASFGGEKFDEIIFLNPHTGAGEPTRQVVSSFLNNAPGQLNPFGSLHIGMEAANPALRVVRTLRAVPFQETWELPAGVRPDVFEPIHPLAAPYDPRRITGDPFPRGTSGITIYQVDH